jgi:hypothetical protein
MSFIEYNANPLQSRKIDCVIRAISTVEGRDWHSVYWGVCSVGDEMCNVPTADEVWGRYLQRLGYTVGYLPNFCPDCITVAEFARDNPTGKYILGTGSHAVAVIDGNWYDTWDSGDEVPRFYWKKGE